MGGFDMFVSVFDSVENNWPNPLNLGSPYNTVGNDLAYVVTFHDKFIYCPQNSNKRRVGISGSDCFSLRMPYEDKIVTLKGSIFIPELSNIIPSDLIVVAIDKNTGDTITIVSPDIDGKFTINDLKVGKITLVAMTSESVETQVIEVVVPKDYKEIEYSLDIYLEAKEIALVDTKETEAIALTVKNIFFNFDKYNIRNEFVQNLNSLASYMIVHPELVIEIQGYCDYYGTDSYNMWLGRMRAQSILSYLVQKGVEKNNMSIISYGESNPIAKSIKSDDSRKYNRRAMIVVKTDTKEISVEEIVIPEEFQIQ
jgi:outer membrane protein OmpA-like peptidoglycan-associated protein